jgi:hypothetical protein
MYTAHSFFLMMELNVLPEKVATKEEGKKKLIDQIRNTELFCIEKLESIKGKTTFVAFLTRENIYHEDLQGTQHTLLGVGDTEEEAMEGLLKELEKTIKFD